MHIHLSFLFLLVRYVYVYYMDTPRLQTKLTAKTKGKQVGGEKEGGREEKC